jgi:DNA repair exonuclease SbcCD ATPase subunit
VGDAIKKVRIKGFQALADVGMVLSPGVNVIVGPSDAGKSSLVRALVSATQQAEGASFVRVGAKKAVVGLEFEDGHRVVWEKGKGVNRYTLDGAKFSRVGRSVPEPVVEALRMAPTKFGEGTERLLQFSVQGEAAFMIADAPSECARLLGGVSGAAMVADAVRRAAKTSSGLARDVKTAEREAEGARASFEMFDGLDDARTLLDALVEQTSDLVERAERLNDCGSDLSSCSSADVSESAAACSLDHARSVNVVFEGLDEIETRFRIIDGAVNDVDRAQGAEDDVDEMSGRLIAATRSLAKSDGLVDLRDRFDELSHIVSIVRRYDDARRLANDSEEIVRRAKGAMSATDAVDEVDARVADFAAISRAVGAHALDSAEVSRLEDVAKTSRSYAAMIDDELNRFVEENPECPLCGASLKGV